MKKLLRSIVVLAAMAMMTLGATSMVSAMEPAVTLKEDVVYGDAYTVRSYTWNQNDKITDTTQGYIIPLVVKKPGVVFIDVTNCSIEKDAWFAVFKDPACDQTTTFYESVYVGEKQTSGHFNAEKAGTYYLKISSNSYKETYTNSATISMIYVSNSEKTVTSGKKYFLAAKSNSDVQYFKYTAKATGFVTVSAPGKYGCYSEFLNSKKSVISEKEYLSSTNKWTTIYAVKKGQTYYVKVSALYPGEIHLLSVNQKAVKEKSGKSKKKAKALKAKKAAKGTVQIGEKGDWYKLKLKKKKALTIMLKVAEQNDLKISLYNSKGKRIDRAAVVGTGTNTFKVTYGSTFQKANKGTYYLKVERNTKKSSGYYELSWK
ncbi:MAG: hypothetical protein K6G64_03875 [Eubacterium sp.]|nr:hypothetical protein [Eubacterium sp.]